jgi:predicted protein tyrosine phosphatase
MNRFRSRTAEDLYKDDSRFNVRSAGIFPDAQQPVTKELLKWADYVVAMEDLQKTFIESSFPDEAARKKIFNLHIPDMFDYMQPQLVKMLKERFENIALNF